MEPSKLQQRVTIQSYSATRESNGEEVKSWSTVATVWAEIRPMFSRELLVARDTQAQATVKIIARYKSGISHKMRAVHGSDTYEIESVVAYPSEDRVEMSCMAAGLAS